MKKSIKLIPRFSKEQHYKINISIICGIICYLSFFYMFGVSYNNTKFNIQWNFIFPFLVSISWGGLYGLISATLGSVGFYTLIIKYDSNIIYYVSFFQTFMCILFQSIGTRERVKNNKFYYNIYFIQFMFILLCSIFYLSIYHNISSAKSYDIYIMIIKSIISELTIISLCEALLLLPIIRKLFLLEVKSYSKNNYHTIGLAIATTVACFVLGNYIYYSKVYINYTLSGLLNIQPGLEVFLYLFLIFNLVSSTTIVKSFEQSIKKNELIDRAYIKYYNIFNNFYDIYFETDLEGQIKVVSPSVKDILGYNIEEFINKNIKQIYLEPSRREAFIEEIIKNKKVTNFEILSPHKDGRVVNIAINAKISMDEDGKPIIIGVSRDITEVVEARKLQRENEKKYKELFNKMLSGYFITEPVFDEEKNLIDFTFVEINPSFEKHTVIKLKDALGKRWIEVFGHKNKNLGIYNKVLRTGESEEYEVFNPHTREYYFVYAFKIDDNHVGVIFRNITKDKNAMEEIKRLNESLEHRVEVRTNELKNAMEELEAFNYTVSHDLKSPLRAIDGYISIIEEEYGENLENSLYEMLRSTRKICDDMIILINKLLHYSTTSKLEIFKEQVYMKDLFIEVFNELKSFNLEMKDALEIDTALPMVMADRILLRQVIYNILSNAIKFTRNKTNALINIGCSESKNEYIFYVKDNGVGFDMKYANKLFGIFQRMHSQEEFEGTGIGLATVKKIISKHGGRTWIEGKVNSGTIIYFTLPVK
ncbi:hypothetical protein CSC2_35420 [Clostridium zeae]|uniref:histidine kinase n=1 Tax=Clostridium zeae TaxID=2759022 RepID=A0ABQ1EDX6_9CLOT|nr:PAS domain-containing sensor histidine kinase [Clostridium zeae]GFZ33016.1 hypothetical protein CSC2_35420 [Clostridium zeae]